MRSRLDISYGAHVPRWGIRDIRTLSIDDMKELTELIGMDEVDNDSNYNGNQFFLDTVWNNLDSYKDKYRLEALSRRVNAI